MSSLNLSNDNPEDQRVSALPANPIGKQLRVCVAKIGEVDYVARVQRCVRAIHAAKKYKLTLIALPARDPKNAPHYPFAVSYLYPRSRSWSFPGVLFVRIVETYLHAIVAFWRVRADVYVIHDIVALGPARLVAWLIGSKVMYNSDELEFHRNQQALNIWTRALDLTHKFLESVFAPRCEMLVQADFARADWMCRRFALRKVHAIRNIPDMWSGGRTQRIRQTLGLSLIDKIILYQGVQGRGRGIEVSIEAISMLEEPKPNFILIGPVSPAYKASTVALAEKLGVRKNVIHINPVPWDELLAWTSGADICLAIIEPTCLSYYLAAPNKFYEAMMAGVPYIASDHPEMRAVHSKYPAGLLVNPVSAIEVACAMRTLLSDSDLSRKCSAEARKACSEEYNWEAESQRFLTLLGQLSDDRAPII